MRRLVALLVAAAALSGCGSDDEPGSPTTGGSTAETAEPAETAETGEAPKPDGAPVVVEIEDFKYVPAALTVPVGATVRWTNADSAPHTATADDGSFDTGNLREGDTGRATLDEPGTYAYFCEFHKFMRARITVR